MLPNFKINQPETVSKDHKIVEKEHKMRNSQSGLGSGEQKCKDLKTPSLLHTHTT